MRVPEVAVDAARRAALEVLRQVDEDDAYANLAMAGILARNGVCGRDAAFATELAYGTLRWQGLYDVIIDSCITGNPSRLEPAIRLVLRLGTHQLLGMRVPAHAAVDASTSLAKGTSERAKGRAGFVNAVLRSISRRDLHGWIAELGLEGDGTPTIDQLSTRWSHPAWIVRAFADALGERRLELPALLEADNGATRPTLVARPGRLSPAELHALPGVRPGRWSPLAGILDGGAPDALPAVRSGAAGVQDEGSQLVALALASAPISSAEGRWLDTCAGPGGKAAMLAGLAAQQGARLLAVEPHAHRAGLVRSALGSAVAEVLQADALAEPWGSARFDRVLVDAPCTGIGALRRRPEARWRRQPSDLVRLGSLQRGLVRVGLRALAPGGVLAYATCSPHLAETESVVRDVVGKDPGCDLIEASEFIGEVPDCRVGPFVQLWPHRHGTDGMFLALIQRRC